MVSSFLKQSFLNGRAALDAFIAKEEHIDTLSRLAHLFSEQFQNGKKGLICGNGGSACDAMHFAEEFTGRYRHERKALPVISLTDSSHITCVGNDFGFDYIFSRGVEAYGQEGDIFIGLSTSGNSPNIIEAFKKAKSMNLHTVLLLGKGGGALKGQADFEFIIQETTSDRIQELHMMILHILIEGVERLMFPENYEK